MTPPIFVIQIGAFSFETSILSVSLRAQWPVVCLGDLKTRPILLAVPEAAGQHKKIDRVIGGKQKRGTMSTSVTSASDLRWYQAIDRKLWIILAITYLGWMLDSMDLNLFTVVLVPSLRELLGPQASPQMIGYYGGAIAAVQLLGWGVGGLIFGILGDYWGRARTLCLSILVYAVFTALSGFATTWWELAIFRFLMAAGVGAEWAIGTALINETWPQRSRVAASGIMMSAFGFGYLLAGVLNLVVGSYGWRWVFFTGIIPALLIALVWREVPESERWQIASRRRNDAAQRLRSGESVSQEDQDARGLYLCRSVPASLAAQHRRGDDHVVRGDGRILGHPNLDSGACGRTCRCRRREPRAGDQHRHHHSQLRCCRRPSDIRVAD